MDRYRYTFRYTFRERERERERGESREREIYINTHILCGLYKGAIYVYMRVVEGTGIRGPFAVQDHGLVGSCLGEH